LYFVKEYGLDYYAAFPGCSSAVEASPAAVAFLIGKVKEENIPAVFHIELSKTEICEAIAEETGAKVLQFNACHNLTAEQFAAGATYILMTEACRRLQPRSAECGDQEILQAERRGEPESLVLRPVAHRRMLPAAPPAFLHRFPFFRALTQRCFRPIPRILRAAPRFVPCSAFPFRTALFLPDVRACRFSLHSVIPLVLQRGGSEIPSAPGKTGLPRRRGIFRRNRF
ncbi:MAG: metal ABC transporter substrate-binding protein, partial [Lachnospiraceae bacterium]